MTSQKNEEIHLDFILKLGDNDQGYVGTDSFSWAARVFPNTNFIDDNLKKRFTRYELFDYCRNPKNDDLNVLIAILSWGGMRRDHGRLLFKNTVSILDIVNKLRGGFYQTRKQAFATIHASRAKGFLPGLGVGYFTKLICFLSPNLNGYIMDQWVGKSINLLTGINLVKITGKTWVNDNNNSDTYEKFCIYIDNHARLMKCSGFEAEKRFFSIGRGRGIWRKYLIKNYDG